MRPIGREGVCTARAKSDIYTNALLGYMCNY